MSPSKRARLNASPALQEHPKLVQAGSSGPVLGPLQRGILVARTGSSSPVLGHPRRRGQEFCPVDASSSTTPGSTSTPRMVPRCPGASSVTERAAAFSLVASGDQWLAGPHVEPGPEVQQVDEERWSQLLPATMGRIGAGVEPWPPRLDVVACACVTGRGGFRCRLPQAPNGGRCPAGPRVEPGQEAGHRRCAQQLGRTDRLGRVQGALAPGRRDSLDGTAGAAAPAPGWRGWQPVPALSSACLHRRAAPARSSGPSRGRHRRRRAGSPGGVTYWS